MYIVGAPQGRRLGILGQCHVGVSCVLFVMLTQIIPLYCFCLVGFETNKILYSLMVLSVA